jgi:RNA polymerase sigma factor (sigma-70 family)
VKIEKLEKIAKTVAYRFNSDAHYDDLVQEGLIKGLELLSEDPEAEEKAVYQVMKKRMYDYLNFDTKGVSIPASDTARAIARGHDNLDNSTYSDAGKDALRAVLEAEWGQYDDDKVAGEQKTGEELLLDKEMVEYLCRSIAGGLTADEAKIIQLRYLEEMTQKETAVEMEMTQQAVQKKEKLALEKIKKGLPASLCNNL